MVYNNFTYITIWRGYSYLPVTKKETEAESSPGRRQSHCLSLSGVRTQALPYPLCWSLSLSLNLNFCFVPFYLLKFSLRVTPPISIPQQRFGREDDSQVVPGFPWKLYLSPILVWTALPHPYVMLFLTRHCSQACWPPVLANKVGEVSLMTKLPSSSSPRLPQCRRRYMTLRFWSGLNWLWWSSPQCSYVWGWFYDAVCAVSFLK